MKMSKLHLALAMSGGGGGGGAGPSGAGASGDSGGVHIGADGVVMVTRHAACWPPGMG